MGSAPSTEIQAILDELKNHGISGNDIRSFLSYIKDKSIDYNWIVNDVSDKSKSKLFSYFKDELKNEILFDALCSVIKKNNTSSNEISNESYKPKRKSNRSMLRGFSANRPSRRRLQRSCAAAPMGRSWRKCSSAYRSLGMDSSFDTIGLSMGGSRDTNNFRKCIDNNVMPSVNSITYNGLLYEYYFDITSTKHVDNISRETDLFYPSYCYAKVKNINNSEKEYYLSVGLNSNIKQNEFKRKHLNLVILLDISGSMTASFDGDNKSFDVDINGEWRKKLKVNDKIDAKDNNNWYHAQVIQVNDDKVKIHYIGWENKYDEYISVNSNQLAPANSSNTKMNSAKKAVLSILKQLTEKDRLAIITFNKNAEIIQNLEFVHDLDLNKLKERISNISASGGTMFERGYNKSIQVYSELFNENDNNYSNRIITLTDAQFRDATLPLIEKDNNIYSTFIGVGLDFNASLIDKISMVRGCNYYSVKTTKEFDDKMNSEFEFMVTPLVFNVCLKIKSEGNSLFIEKVFGSNNDDIMNKGEIARIHTLFPSKKRSSNSNSFTKGGIQLIKLKKKGNDIDDNDNMNIELLVSFEDRNGKQYENVQRVIFKTPKEKGNNDMIESDEKEKEEMNINFYDNKGIRKAILLCHYVDLMKEWIKVDGANNYHLKMNDEYKKIFTHFKQHFKVEMSECRDDTLQKEVDLMHKLIKLSN